MKTVIWVSWNRLDEPWVHNDKGDVHKCNVLVDQDESCHRVMVEDQPGRVTCPKHKDVHRYRYVFLSGSND